MIPSWRTSLPPRVYSKAQQSWVDVTTPPAILQPAVWPTEKAVRACHPNYPVFNVANVLPLPWKWVLPNVFSFPNGHLVRVYLPACKCQIPIFGTLCKLCSLRALPAHFLPFTPGSFSLLVSLFISGFNAFPIQPSFVTTSAQKKQLLIWETLPSTTSFFLPVRLTLTHQYTAAFRKRPDRITATPYAEVVSYWTAEPFLYPCQLCAWRKWR